MNNGLPPGLDLSARGQIAVAEHVIIAPAAVDGIQGSLDGIPGAMALRVIDVAHAKAYYVPMELAFVRRLAKQLLSAAEKAEGNQQQEGRTHD